MPIRFPQAGSQNTQSLDAARYQEDPDVQLMLRVQRDEAGAFEELMAQWRTPLKARFLRTLRNVEEAEDLTQEVFLRLFRSRKRYQPTARFSTWLFQITQNLARTAFQRRRKHAPTRGQGFTYGSTQGEFEPITGLDDPALCSQREEIGRMVRAAVAALIWRQRIALEMYQFQNRSYAEIAAAMKMSPEATKSLIYRARIHLRDMISTSTLVAC